MANFVKLNHNDASGQYAGIALVPTKEAVSAVIAEVEANVDNYVKLEIYKVNTTIDDSMQYAIDESKKYADRNIGKSVTYKELLLLIKNSQLHKGAHYIITDFKTVYIQPVSKLILEGSIEPLIVRAANINALEPIAHSELYPEDIIYYDVTNNNINIREWATVNDNGQIYRRISKNKNDLPYDSRAIKFRRWKFDSSQVRLWNKATVYNLGSVVLYNNNYYISTEDNNIPAITAVGLNPENMLNWVYAFNADNYFIDSYDSSNNWVRKCKEVDVNFSVDLNNYKDYYTFDDDSGVNVIDGMSVYSNSIGSCFSTRDDTFQHKYLIKEVLPNTVFIGDCIYFNAISNDFKNNTIYDYFYLNKIGNSFSDNLIGLEFNTNTVENYFNKNNIGKGFSLNTLGHDINNNIIGNSFKANRIANNFYQNAIHDNFASNDIGNYLYNNTIGNEFKSNEIGNYFNNNAICDYFSNNSAHNNVQFLNFININKEVSYNDFSNGLRKSQKDSYLWPIEALFLLSGAYAVKWSYINELLPPGYICQDVNGNILSGMIK